MKDKPIFMMWTTAQSICSAQPDSPQAPVGHTKLYWYRQGCRDCEEQMRLALVKAVRDYRKEKGFVVTPL